jgi:hypothetical protein
MIAWTYQTSRTFNTDPTALLSRTPYSDALLGYLTQYKESTIAGTATMRRTFNLSTYRSNVSV